jgi:hypothetical protein
MMAEPFAEAAGERVERALGVLIEMPEVQPTERHWYLEGLGTHPDWQRRAIASAVQAPILGTRDADGLPAYLETHRESNDPFYHRHGFEAIGTKQLSTGAPNLWLMWRGSDLSRHPSAADDGDPGQRLRLGTQRSNVRTRRSRPQVFKFRAGSSNKPNCPRRPPVGRDAPARRFWCHSAPGFPPLCGTPGLLAPCSWAVEEPNL